MSPLVRNFLAFVVATGALAAVILGGVAPGAAQSGALIGVAAGFVSGAVALGGVARLALRSFSAGLVAMAFGFLLRMLIVPAALLIARAHGGGSDGMLGCTVGFFLLYIVGQGLEIALVSARPRPQEQA